MHSLKQRFGSALVALAISLTILGCGGDGKPKVLPAGGKVSLKGSTTVPDGALVVFHPKDPAFEKAMSGKPVAKVGKDGTFKLTSYQEGDGAPAADYNVTIVWNTPAGASKFAMNSEGGGSGPDRLGGRYGDPRNPKLTATVKEGTENTFTFELDAR